MLNIDVLVTVFHLYGESPNEIERISENVIKNAGPINRCYSITPARTLVGSSNGIRRAFALIALPATIQKGEVR